MKRTNENRTTTPASAVTTDWRTIAVVIICGVALAAGFFFAARQHFLSMDMGFKNSKLRKQLEDLESEKRRLLLAREVSLSPIELKKAARVVASTDVRVNAQQAAFRTTLPASTAATTAVATIKPATAFLSKPKTAKATSPDKDDVPKSKHPGIELAAAINLR
jgi:hypothetical protein